MKILLTKEIHQSGLTLLKSQNIDFDICEIKNLASRDMVKYSGIISMLSDNIDKDFLHLNNHLKVISNYAVGFNNIDIKTAKELNIKIGNTPDVLTDATADIAFGLILSVTRNFKQGMNNVSEGKWKTWEPLGFLGMGLKGKTLGIIGLGRIGKEVAYRAKFGFGMNVVYYHPSKNDIDSNYQHVSLEKLFKTSDIVSLHCPLTSLTNNLVNKDNISKMKDGSYFINTARGLMHNEKDLHDALLSGKLRGVGLDVTNPEPMESDSKLLNHPNSIILPHIGSATDESRESMSIICAENIINGLKGLKLKCEVC